jgi:RHS repeat-associated protein
VRDFSVRVGFVNGSSTQWVEADFNPCVSGWQYASAAAVPTAAFTSIKVQVRYSAGMNSVCFDGVQLYKERFGSEYGYDANGNLTDTTGENGSGVDATYTNNDLTNVTLPAGGDIDYTYDGYHRPTGATSATGVLFGMTYDATTGHLTASKEGSATTYVRSTSEYSTATGSWSRYLTKVTDPFGKQVQYGYDLTRGLNTSVTQPNGQVISHTYQTSSGLLTGTSATVTGLGTVTNGYTYGNNSRITEIRHNTAGADVVYGFAYNALGWLTGVTVGGNSLVTNTYQAYSGRLNSVAYGNSQTVNYSYDAFDRVVGVSLGTTQKYAFDYDATGQVGYLDDKVQNKQYWYLSDLAGRLSEIRRSDGNSTRYTYNASNQVTAFNETISGTSYSTTYSYDNDQRMTALASGLLAVAVGYDTANNLDRVLTVTRAYNGVNKITTTYGYQAGAAGQSVTSKRVASVTNGSKTAIGYAYDDNGNIATITQGSDVSEYFYDGLNQLKRENVSVAGTTPYTRTFSYDVGGNILEKKTYSYVAGNTTLGTLQSTDTYVYGDTAWKDKLTTYNGVTMTYDGIGNPLTWTDPNGAWTATWTMGRQLATLSKTGTSISYKYGADGIRTEKTVNGVTTVYNVVGGVVTWEKTGTNPAIHYTYDVNGQLFSLEYNGSSWFYVRNAQNDVIGLVEASTGNWAAQYVYDAWGKPLAILNGNGNDVSGNATHIANINPYRYRGYRYDTENGMYYLNSRYYNPSLGRFTNSDEFSLLYHQKDLLGMNLYQYCDNNPINKCDEFGFWPSLAKVFTAVLVTVAIIVVGVACGPVGLIIATAMACTAMTGCISGGVLNVAIGGALNNGKSWQENLADGMYDGYLGGVLSGGITSGYAAYTAGKLLVFTSLKDRISSITNQPKLWKEISKNVEAATRKGIRDGGKSVQIIYENIKTGEQIVKHILMDKFGKIIESHYRDVFK